MHHLWKIYWPSRSALEKFRLHKILEPTSKLISPKPKPKPTVSKWDPMLLIDDDSDILLSSPHVPEPWCQNYDYVYIYVWANDKTVQDALHIREGYVLGNPATDVEIDSNSRVPFAHLKALISDKLYESFKKNCKGEYYNPDQSNVSCMEDILAIEECNGKIWAAQILEPTRKVISPKPKPNPMVSKWDPMLLIDDDSDILLLGPHVPGPWCRSYDYVYIYTWANDKTVEDALHIHKGSKKDWKRCNKTLSCLENVPSTIDYHRNLTKKPYRALFYRQYNA